MTPWRILAPLPAALGIVMCLAALTTGGGPALAAQDVFSQQAAAMATLPAAARTSEAAEHARLARTIGKLEIRAAEREARADHRQWRRRIERRQAAEAAAQQQAVQGSLPPASSQPVASGGAFVMPSGFEGCVISRESGGNPTAYNSSSGASGLFGFLLSTWLKTPEGAAYPGGAYTAPASVQEQAFQWMFAQDGVAPWRPYDGC